MIGIKDIQKTTLIDFPGRIAATVFIQGCNFRCPFCHNYNLIESDDEIIPEKRLLKFIRERKNFFDGIAFTGGEPSLYPGLNNLFKKIKEYDLDIKLDTNGSKPQKIKNFIDKNLVDYVAMDIKADFDNYNKLIGIDFDKEILNDTINILKSSTIEYEFRTTVIPGVITTNIIDKIIKNIIGEDIEKYVLQRYQRVEGYVEKEHSKNEWKKIEDRYEKYENIEFRDNF